MKYRPEIDGLRALAVIFVILYHAQITTKYFPSFEGGFIGVDIFFVISGYLISKIIFLELDVGSLKLVNFFERRSRRILPVLFLVILVTTIIGWIKLPPLEFKKFAESVISAQNFFSNFFFYFASSDYYNQNTLMMPLIHTWSLAVEEQFYIVFPFLSIIFYKYFKKNLAKLLIFIIFLSFIFSNYMSEKNAIFNFYLPYSRIWELIVGSLLAYNELYLKSKKNHNFTLLPLGGVIIIFFSIYFFDENTVHPSIYTIFPIFGTSLIIKYSSEREPIGKILRIKFFTFIGLISYSLYLWHFPVLVFSRIENDLSNIDKFGLIIVTFIISILSYFFIEKPFRDKSVVKIRLFIISIIFTYVIILFSALFIINTNGAEFYLKPKELKETPKEKTEANIAVLGDSHAHHLEYGLQVLTDGMIRMFQSPGCVPFRDIDRFDYRQKAGNCINHTNKSINLINDSKTLDTVILSTMGPVYLDNTVFQNQDRDRIKQQKFIDKQNPNITDRYLIFKNGFKRTVEEFYLNNKKIIFIIDIPELGKQFHSCISKNHSIRWRVFGPLVEGNLVNKIQCRFEKELFLERTQKYNELILELKKDFPYVVFLDTSTNFCDLNYCYGYKDNTFLYKNADHLNNHGSLFLASYILKYIK